MTNLNGISKCRMCGRPTASPFDRICPSSGCRKKYMKYLELQVKEQKANEQAIMQRIIQQIRKELELKYVEENFP